MLFGVMDDALTGKINISFPRINHWGHQLHLKIKYNLLKLI